MAVYGFQAFHGIKMSSQGMQFYTLLVAFSSKNQIMYYIAVNLFNLKLFILTLSSPVTTFDICSLLLMFLGSLYIANNMDPEQSDQGSYYLLP